MNWFALLMSLYLPLSATQGADGIPPPGVVDFAKLHRKTHSEYFLAPPGFSPRGDGTSPVYAIDPPTLFADLQAVGAAMPRTYRLDVVPAALQAAWVTRSAAGNFPDIIEFAVVPQAGHRSSFVFYAHAVYGWFDYGVNHKHAKRWLKDLSMKVAE